MRLHLYVRHDTALVVERERLQKWDERVTLMTVDSLFSQSNELQKRRQHIGVILLLSAHYIARTNLNAAFKPQTASTKKIY